MPYFVYIVPIRIQVFGSTSSGNTTFIDNGDSALFVDCGMGIRHTEKCLSALRTDISRLSGVLLTHVHRDHASGPVLKALARKGIPLHCHHTAVEHFLAHHPKSTLLEKFELIRSFDGDGFSLGNFGITPFAVPHDSPGGSHGYVIEATSGDNRRKIVMSTDLGKTDDTLVPFFANADVVVLESNHDPDMLRNSGRPVWLQQRIRDVHLSNEESSAFLARAIRASTHPPSAIFLAHVSQECNTFELARQRLETELSRIGSPVRIVETFKSKASEVITVG